MSQLAPIAFSSMPPVLPSNIAALAEQSFTDAFSGFSSGLRWVRHTNNGFELRRGGSTEDTIMVNAFVAVLLKVSPYNHCTWYERDFAPGQEPEQPNLVWLDTQGNGTHPAPLPPQFRQKIVKNGREVWAYKIARRTVWALAKMGPTGVSSIDFDNPVLLDISSSSLFGHAQPQAGIFKWNELAAFCKQRSGNGFVCSPTMFLTRIVPDNMAHTIGVWNFQPMLNQQTGQLEYLPYDLIEQAFTRAQAPDVVENVMVKEKLTMDGSAVQTPVQQPVAPVQQPVAPVQQPVAPVQQPVAPVQQPVAPVQQPVAPVQAQKPVLTMPQEIQVPAAEDMSAEDLAALAAQTAQILGGTASVVAPVAPAQPAATNEDVAAFNAQSLIDVLS